jgi:hypothetical protein
MSNGQERTRFGGFFVFRIKFPPLIGACVLQLHPGKKKPAKLAGFSMPGKLTHQNR